MTEVVDITSRWKKFALVLGVKKTALEEIERKCPGMLMYTMYMNYIIYRSLSQYGVKKGKSHALLGSCGYCKGSRAVRYVALCHIIHALHPHIPMQLIQPNVWMNLSLCGYDALT